MDLVELTAIRPARSPNTFRIAAVSAGSFSRVPVPWALT
jgi:hypothetical protein